MNGNERNIRFMFAGFLENHEWYDKCEEYWINAVKKITGDEFEKVHFLENKYANGEKCYDANPIVAFIYKNIVVRIILLPESEYKRGYQKLCLNQDKFVYEDREYDEFVMSLYMLPRTVSIAKDVLEEWIMSENLSE